MLFTHLISGGQSRVLRYAELKITKQAVCRRSYEGIKAVHICAVGSDGELTHSIVHIKCPSQTLSFRRGRVPGRQRRTAVRIEV